jgi:hypothetical protein
VFLVRYETRYLSVRYVVFTAVTMKNAVSGMLRHVAPIRTDVSEERSISIIRVTRIGELGTTPTQAAKDIAFLRSVRRLLVRVTLFLVHRFL